MNNKSPSHNNNNNNNTNLDGDDEYDNEYEDTQALLKRVVLRQREKNWKQMLSSLNKSNSNNNNNNQDNTSLEVNSWRISEGDYLTRIELINHLYRTEQYEGAYQQLLIAKKESYLHNQGNIFAFYLYSPKVIFGYISHAILQYKRYL